MQINVANIVKVNCAILPIHFQSNIYNNRKYTSINVSDPVTGKMVSLYNPRQHHWQDHFTWTDNYSQMLGRSPIGRVTVEKLQLNREGVVNLRRALRSLNEHPPIISSSELGENEQ